MPKAYVVTTEMLTKFKEPFGTLIEGAFSETMNKLAELIKKEKPTKIISVGDTVSLNLHEHHIIPQVSIIDNQTLRKKVQPQIFAGKDIVQVKNPQGTITQEAISAIQEALQNKRQTQIVVDGEEDLLTLIAVLYAPENSMVIYGQPHKGIVVVKVTPEKRADAQKIWEAIKTGKNQ
jgi:GTP-dependent dephospho-CoA kinase